MNATFGITYEQLQPKLFLSAGPLATKHGPNRLQWWAYPIIHATCEWVQVFNHYFEELEEELLRDNFVVVVSKFQVVLFDVRLLGLDRIGRHFVLTVWVAWWDDGFWVPTIYSGAEAQRQGIVGRAATAARGYRSADTILDPFLHFFHWYNPTTF
jgi:hypothetical protein